MRDAQINIRLSQEEFERCKLVTTHYDITLSDLFRIVLNRAYELLQKPKKG